MPLRSSGRERTQRDVLVPAFLKTGVAHDIAPEQARFALAAAGDRFYVAPMSRSRPPGNSTIQAWACLFGLRTGLTCGPLESIARGYSLLSADHMPGQRAGEAVLAGLAPDGVTRVSVQVCAEGPTYTALPTNNVWVLRLNASAQQTPHRLTFYGDGGRRLATREGR